MHSPYYGGMQLSTVGNLLPMPLPNRTGGHILASARLAGWRAGGELHGLNRRIDEV